MANVQVWIHLMWSTKNRNPTLISEKREPLFDYIKENAREKGIYIDSINGGEDHIHLLVGLQADQSILKVVQSVKGESCYWAKRQHLFNSELEWQADFTAVSVSESSLDAVRNYIAQQTEIHQNKTYQQEYDAFIKKYGFNKSGKEKPRARTIKTRGFNTGLVMRTE